MSKDIKKIFLFLLKYVMNISLKLNLPFFYFGSISLLTSRLLCNHSLKGTTGAHPQHRKVITKSMAILTGASQRYKTEQTIKRFTLNSEKPVWTKILYFDPTYFKENLLYLTLGLTGNSLNNLSENWIIQKSWSKILFFHFSKDFILEWTKDMNDSWDGLLLRIMSFLMFDDAILKQNAIILLKTISLPSIFLLTKWKNI